MEKYMKTEEFVKIRVSKYYWNDDINCVTTTLKILSEVFEIKLNKQIIDAAIGMHGAGEYGAQCGLVEGTLLFLGIFGRENNIPDNIIVDYCREFANQFENEFKSLQCSILRPESFHPDNLPHLCEPLTCKAVEFSINFISALRERLKQRT
ncbi:C-GCAxxG-C-C family (seleno)protein [Desulfovulcanus sp.]